MTRRRRAREESGFAILLVFALAAVLAITLYMELPRSMFERTREREQLLIDRGEQYSLAVRRFYVKFGRFPAKMDDLENTNNMRFLRRQYKDPMTGEADWRIVHEAGGVLSDSLVHPAPKAQGKDSSGQSFGSLTSSMPFGSSMTASSTGAASEEAAPKAPGLLSRPSDRGPLGTSHGGVSTDNDSTQLPAYADNGAAPSSPDASAPAGDAATNPAQAGGAPTTPDPNAAANQAAAGAPGGGQVAAAPGDVAQMINNSLRGPRQVSNPAASQSQLTGGGIGIAGVASKSEFRGIKTYNDRHKYKEWEFVFDLSMMQQQQQQPGQQSSTGPGK